MYRFGLATFVLILDLINGSQSIALPRERRSDEAIVVNASQTFGLPLNPRDGQNIQVRGKQARSLRDACGVGYLLIDVIADLWTKSAGLAPQRKTYSADTAPIALSWVISSSEQIQVTTQTWAFDSMLRSLLYSGDGTKFEMFSVYEVDDASKSIPNIAGIVVSDKDEDPNAIESSLMTRLANAADSKSKFKREEDNSTALVADVKDLGARPANMLLNLKWGTAEVKAASLIWLYHHYLLSMAWSRGYNDLLYRSYHVGQAFEFGPDPSRPNSPRLIIEFKQTAAEIEGQEGHHPLTWYNIYMFSRSFLRQVIKEKKNVSFSGTAVQRASDGSRVELFKLHIVAAGENAPVSGAVEKVQVPELSSQGGNTTASAK